jgi:hypothetical protein
MDSMRSRTRELRTFTVTLFLASTFVKGFPACVARGVAILTYAQKNIFQAAAKMRQMENFTNVSH